MKILTTNWWGKIQEWRKHDGIKRYFLNTSWLFIGKIVSLFISFFLFSYVARYLGPTNLGNLSYAQSFVFLIGILASFGIDNVLYRDFIKMKEQRRELVGSAIFLKVILGFLTTAVTITVAYFTQTEPLLTLLIVIISLTNIFQPFSTPGLYFDAIQKSSWNTMGMIGVNIILATLKLLVIAFNKGIIFFAIIIVIETILYSIYSLYLFTKNYDSIRTWRVDFKIIKSLLHESIPLFLASISSVIYTRIDSIMLKHYLDSAAVGFYDVVVKIGEVWYFIPGLIIVSVFPALINAKLVNERSYEKRFSKLFWINMSVSVVFCLGISIFAGFLIHIIAGDQYLLATKALQIYVWGGIGMTATLLARQLLVAEKWTKVTFYATMWGAFLNIGMNIWLIPRYGITGASLSTLISYLAVPTFLLFVPEVRNKIKAIVVHFIY